MNVNENIWGSPFTLLDSINTRTGASDLTDIDYTNFPPFVRNNLSSIGDIGNPAPTYFENDCIYIAYLNEHGMGTPWDPGADMDKSIAYCACINTNLTIYNTIIIGTGKYDSIISDNFNYIIPNQDKAIAARRTGGSVPIFFKNGETYFRHKPSKGVYPLDGVPYLPFYNPASTSHPIQKMYMWSPDGLIDTTSGYSSSTERGKVNNNAYISYWRDFGIRSLFGVILVIYFDGTYSQTDGTPQNVVQSPVSLHWYETQTDTWKAGHPILGAYLNLYFRRNTDGTYTSTKPVNMCFVAEISNGIELVNADKWGDDVGAKIWQPTQSLRDACNSFFPLFGDEQLGARIDTNITGTVQIGAQLTTSGNDGISRTGGCLVGYQDKSWLHSGQRYSGTSMVPYKTMWLEMEGTSENLELLRKSAAAYGLFFADDEYNLADAGRDTSRWIDNNMCLGVVDENGFTDGTYTRGADNVNANNWNWKTASESRYDPSRPPTPPAPSYDYETDLPNNLSFEDENYFISKTLGEVNEKMNLQNLYTAITTIAETAYSTLEEGVTALANATYSKKFLYQDPLKCVLDYRMVFLTTPHTRAYSSEQIPLGSFVCPAEYPFTGYNALKYRRETLGSFEFERIFGDFRDFEPYTQAILYVPYCGVKQLPMSIFAGHTVNIYVNINNYTGELQVLLFVDNIEWGTMNGMASEELPLIGDTSMTAAAQKRAIQHQIDVTQYQKTTGILGSIAGATISAAMANPAGVVTQAASAGLKAMAMNNEIHELEFKQEHTVAEPLTIQKGSSEIAHINVLQPFIMLQTPTIIEIDGKSDAEIIELYRKTKGQACLMPGTIGDFSGLTKCSTAILDGISCTFTEKQMILEALQEGVIL